MPKTTFNFSQHSVFKDAMADLEALGLHVSPHASANAIPYAVIGGRSNARWWLLPLTNRDVAVGGLALFQPVLKTAILMKRGVAALSQMGLTWLWARSRLYLAGEPSVAQWFGQGHWSCAYFTGTDSPHRKVAVQVMDLQGNIKGFAKLTKNAQVRELLMHEAATLGYLRELNLQAGYVPKVLFAGQSGASTLLVTDTLKNRKTRTTTQFLGAHRAFLQELAARTAVPQGICLGDIASDFRRRLLGLSKALDAIWCGRLDRAIRALDTQAQIALPASLIHGDFTPWNTFLSHGRLYVFDWEYARQKYPNGIDVIHFALSQPQARSKEALAKIAMVQSCLLEPWTGVQAAQVPLLLLIYLVMQSLLQIERLGDPIVANGRWDGAQESAVLLDILLARPLVAVA